MDNLIVIGDFNNPYLPYAGADSAAYLNDIITQYQKPILTQILGEVEYNNFNDDLTGIVPGSTEWEYFLDGTTYVHDSVSYVFPGIKPILTKFMFYYWQRDTVNDLAETGQLKKNLLNASQVIPAHKMTAAYNDSVDEIINVREYSPTVYHFMNHMQDDNDYFPDWDFTTFIKINIFNL